MLGSATMGPNRPGRGSHVATASFMVDRAARGQRASGRALGEHVLAWAREAGFRAIQFNAVVETNTARGAAVALARLRDRRHRAGGLRQPQRTGSSAST